MEDSAPPPAAPHPLKRSHLWLKLACFLGLSAAVFAGIEFVASRFLATQLHTISLPISVVVLFGLTGSLLAAGGAVHLYTNWLTPVRRLRAALEEIRDGAL